MLTKTTEVYSERVIVNLDCIGQMCKSLKTALLCYLLGCVSALPMVNGWECRELRWHCQVFGTCACYAFTQPLPKFDRIL